MGGSRNTKRIWSKEGIIFVGGLFLLIFVVLLSLSIIFVVTTKRYGNDSQFTQYVSENGDEFLISDLSRKKYECYGSCYCGDEYINDRRSSSVLSRGLTVSIAALSSAVAFQTAKNVLTENCVDQLSDSCDLVNVHAKVDDCVEDVIKDYQKHAGDLKKFVDREKWPKRYSCSGNCIKMDFNFVWDKVEEATKQSIFKGQKEVFANYFSSEANKVGCENLNTAAEVFVKKEFFLSTVQSFSGKLGASTSVVVDEFGDRMPVNALLLKLAKLEFSGIKLNDYCHYNSRLVPGDTDSPFFCAGMNVSREGKFLDNPSIQCVRLE